MFTTKRALDAYKGYRKLPFSLGKKRSQRVTDSPDYTILKKITEPVLPPLALNDEKTKQNRDFQKLQENNLFGRDYILGKEFTTILNSVHENHGFVLVVGFLSETFNNQEYVLEHQMHKLGNELAGLDVVYTHRYAKHVRDYCYKNSTNPSYNALSKISWLNTDICYSYDMKNLSKTISLIKRNQTNFILLGGVANNICMTVSQLEKAAKDKYTQEKLDKVRGETIGILASPIQTTHELMGRTVNEFGSIIGRLANDEIGKTSRYLGQHQQELAGLLAQMVDNKKDEN